MKTSTVRAGPAKQSQVRGKVGMQESGEWGAEAESLEMTRVRADGSWANREEMVERKNKIWVEGGEGKRAWSKEERGQKCNERMGKTIGIKRQR